VLLHFLGRRFLVVDAAQVHESVWWADKTLVNGVFKGGGAKGVAYAGALRAFRERGYWFGSVAGASAGAITATLIAAGLSPEDIETQVPVALQQLAGSVPARLFSLVRGTTSSLFDSQNLRGWLEGVLREECQKRLVRPAGLVTFGDLFEATGVELYVVVMDLASGTPVVFSRRSTPSVEIGAAVTSSCAIPGAFPPGRAVFRSPNLGAGVHQLVDGGTFANYPTFVFKDQSFRRWIGSQDDIEQERPTVGFVLGEPEQIDRQMRAVGFVDDESPKISKRFDIGPTYTAESPGPYAFGAILGNDWARLALIIAITVWAGLSVGFFPQGVRLVSTWLGFLPGSLFALAVVALFVVLILTAGGAFLSIVVLISISRMVADTLIPAAKSAIGVATEVVPWSGFGDDDILLVVPHPGLDTTQFVVPAATRAAAVEAAYHSVKAQLATPELSEKLGVGGSAAQALALIPSVEERMPSSERSTWHQLYWSFRLACIIAVFVGLLGWFFVNRQGTVTWFWQSLLIGSGALVTAIVGLVIFARSSGKRAAAHARVGIDLAEHATRPALVVLLAAVAIFIGGILMSNQAFQTRARDTYRVKIVQASLLQGGSKVYSYVREGKVVTFESEADLALGELIYVRQNDSEVGLVGPIDNWQFPLAVGLEVLGLSLFLAGYRASSWAKRSNRLVGWLAVRSHTRTAPERAGGPASG
jgi:predicted acylesterase/phospholipase RssA